VIVKRNNRTQNRTMRKKSCRMLDLINSVHEEVREIGHLLPLLTVTTNEDPKKTDRGGRRWGK